MVPDRNDRAMRIQDTWMDTEVRLTIAKEPPCWWHSC